MRVLRRVLCISAIIIAVLLIGGAASGYWFVSKSLPQTDGTLHVAGLKSTVEVVRDPLGVPHIYADNVDDLFFAQGYVHAQDRLWQMEYDRRIAWGTLSDVFGAVTIKQDRYLRTIGLGRAARADLVSMADDEKRPLILYAAGVNAFIASHQDNLPIEFSILQFKPAPWDAVDTLAWAKVMAYDLGGNYETELLRASLVDKFDPDRARDLLPPYPSTGPFIIPPQVKRYGQTPEDVGSAADLSPLPPFPAGKGENAAHSKADQVHDPSPLPTEKGESGYLSGMDKAQDSSPFLLGKGQGIGSIGTPNLNEIASIDDSLGLRAPDVGSNNWVIDGSKSTTGKPILANDPHLAIQMPSVWYENGLHCVPQSDNCLFNVVGFTFPGVPGVVVGHDDWIAWGVTNTGPDVQDLFVEKINPQNPNQYEFQDKWQDIQVIDEPIKVKGVVSETLHVQVTRHGPIMTQVLPGVTQPVALQWTALRDRSRLFEGLMLLNHARNWDEFRAALRLWNVPAQNFVYADIYGNIGYQMPGNVPIRAQGDGSVPVPGTGEYEWTGYIPFDQLPSVYNPSSHWIASANNAVVPESYPYLITRDWAAPYRAQRIADLLAAKDRLSIDDFKAMQGDVLSVPEVTLQQYIVTLVPEGFLEQRAMAQVKSWDGRLTQENIGGTIVEVTFQRLLTNVFAPKMGPDLFKSYQNASDYARAATLALLAQPASEWWGPQGRDAMLKKSYAEAVDWLGSQFGDAPVDWHWGRLHTATFAHPLGSVQPLDRLFNAGPVGAPGGVSTLFATSFKYYNPYAAASISSMRELIDLANWGNALQVNTTGQSGQPLSSHYGDMVPMWQNVQYAPLYFDRAALDRVKAGTLVLAPP